MEMLLQQKRRESGQGQRSVHTQRVRSQRLRCACSTGNSRIARRFVHNSHELDMGNPLPTPTLGSTWPSRGTQPNATHLLTAQSSQCTLAATPLSVNRRRRYTSHTKIPLTQRRVSTYHAVSPSLLALAVLAIRSKRW